MTRQLSSSSTFFYKRVFPAVWFGFVGLFLVGMILGSVLNDEFPVGFTLIPAIMLVMGFFIMKLFVFDLVDEVFEEGDSLVVRNGGRSERIPFSSIINVNSNAFVNPPRITLTLREPCIFGKEVSFSPPKKIGFSLRNPLAADLIERIDASRRVAEQAEADSSVAT